jgi:hypothetical protein
MRAVLLSAANAFRCKHKVIIVPLLSARTSFQIPRLPNDWIAEAS